MSSIFGQIISGQIPAEKVFENDRLVVIKDIAPIAPVHLLIIPKCEVFSVEHAGEQELKLLPEIFTVAQQLAKQFEITEGYRIVINSGTKAGQTIFHWHFHLLGGKNLGAMG